MKFRKCIALLLAPAVAVIDAGSLQSQAVSPNRDPANAHVLISSRSPSPIEPGFAGYNIALMDVAFNYRDPRFAAQVKRLGLGWLRYPAGTRSEAFDWTTGTSPRSWVDRVSLTFTPDVQSDFRRSLQRTREVLEAKSGEHADDAAALAASAGAEGLIVCVNVFTDTPESARKFAAYAKQHRLRVIAWELGNEPYFNRRRWPTATAYASAVHPFADAIRKGDSTAKIGVSMSDAGFADSAWDNALASFRPRYWDFVIYHHYPIVGGAPAEMMAALNQVLLHETTDYVQSQVASRFGSMPVMITEAGPQDGPEPGMSGTMYGGIWSAEYAMRMSSIPQVKHFGIHQLVGAAGVGVTDGFVRQLVAGRSKGKRLNIDSLDFGLYQSAQGAAYALAASVMDSSTAVYQTSVEGGGSAPLPNGESTSAIFAMAYRLRGDTSVLVLTNKAAREETISISMDGRPIETRFLVTTVSAADPSARNAAGHEAIAPRRFVAPGPIHVPPYSVTRISW